MKRTILLFLGMLCFYVCTCTLHAEAETSSLEQIAVQKITLTVLNGELYGISGEILYQFIPEDNQAKALGDVPDASLMLSSHGKSLIGLSSSTGTAYCWENNSWKPEVKVDLEELENVQFLDFAVTQRSLFLLLFDFEANSQRIVIIERATGQIAEDFISSGITEIASFNSSTDCIACLCQSKEGKGEYGIVNEKGYYHKTGEMPVPGRGLALENNQIWFHSGDIVYRVDAQGITEVMMIRSDPREDNSDAAVLNGHYILLNQGHFPTNANLSDASENKIVMSFFASADTHEKALQLSGLTCEIRNEMFFYQKQISELLLAQDSLIDIYYIDGAFLDVSPIFSKGYYMPLDSQLLREAVKRMHPSLREMVLQGEKLMALPVLAHPSKYTPVVNLPVVQQAKKLGYHLPETFDEYIKQIAAWPDSLAEEGILPLEKDAWYLVEQVLYQLILDADNQMTQINQEHMVQLLIWTRQAVERMSDCHYITMHEPVYIMLNSQPLFWTEKSMNCRYLPLPLSEGRDKKVGIDVSILFINPYSKHISEALAYMEAYISSLSAEQEDELFSDAEHIIERAYYKENRKNCLANIDMLNKLIEDTKDDMDRTALEDTLDAFQKDLEIIEQDRYTVDKESLSTWKNLMADARIVPWKILQEPRTIELIRKFLSDDLMPEEFTHQFLQIAQMSELEDQ